MPSRKGFCKGSWAVRPTSDQKHTDTQSGAPCWAETLLTLLRTWSQQQVPWKPRAAVDEARGAGGAVPALPQGVWAHMPAGPGLKDPTDP